MKKIIILLSSILVFGFTYSQNLNEVIPSKTKGGYSENDTVPKVVYLDPKGVYSKEEESNKPLISLNGKFIGNAFVNPN